MSSDRVLSFIVAITVITLTMAAVGLFTNDAECSACAGQWCNPQPGCPTPCVCIVDDPTYNQGVCVTIN